MQRVGKKALESRGKDYIVWWALLEGMADLKMNDEDREKVFRKGDFVEVEFKMNGVELDFKNVMKTWEGQVNRMILEKANELISEKFSLETINDLMLEFENKLRTAINKEDFA